MVGGRLSTTVRLTRTIARVGARAECALLVSGVTDSMGANFLASWPKHPPRSFLCTTVEATDRLPRHAVVLPTDLSLLAQIRF